MRTKRSRVTALISAMVLCAAMFIGCSGNQNAEKHTIKADDQTSSDPREESTELGSVLLPENVMSSEGDEQDIETPDNVEMTSDGSLTDTKDHSEPEADLESTEEETTEESREQSTEGQIPSDESTEVPVTDRDSGSDVDNRPETSTDQETGLDAMESSEMVTQDTKEEPESSTMNTKAPEETTGASTSKPTAAPVEITTEAKTEEKTEECTESEAIEDSTEVRTEETTEAAVVLQAISIKANQSQYTAGWQLTKANLTVTVHYSDGTSGTLTNGYTIHQTDDQVFVTYAGIESNTISVVYEKTLSSISIESKADQYEQGYQIISSNLSVTLHYSDGSRGVLTNGYSIHQTGASVYVSYSGINSNTITINYAAASRVTIEPKQERYLLGEVITLDDFVVTVHQIDGSSEVVTEGLVLLYQDQAVDSVVLQEYVGDVYMLYGYGFKVSYKGIVSEAVRVEVRYEEKPFLCTEMLDLVNEARREAGLSDLQWDAAAEDEILLRAEELTQLYAHNRPSGELISELYGDFWGENIASGGFRSKTHAQTVFSAWMNSPGHESLIMDSFDLATGFVCAYYIATDANGYQAAYTVMWVTTN